MLIHEADRRISDARADFAGAITAAAGPAQRWAVNDARSGFERWVQTMQGEFATFRAGDRQSAVAASLGPDRTLRKTYEQSLANAPGTGGTFGRVGRELGAAGGHGGAGSYSPASWPRWWSSGPPGPRGCPVHRARRAGRARGALRPGAPRRPRRRLQHDPPGRGRPAWHPPRQPQARVPAAQPRWSIHGIGTPWGSGLQPGRRQVHLRRRRERAAAVGPGARG
jgi:hypothetical protein